MNQLDLSSIEIRNLDTIAELEEVRRLETLVWSLEDSVPVNQSVAVVKNGGFILGAYLEGKLVGFQYSFPGFDGSKVYLCSHSLGIHPEYRRYGIGEKLKKAQKELAAAKGYKLITWTYDPLETVNGNLNLHKLGAKCTCYLENVYGEMADGLNDGLPTDRFLVEWKTDSPVGPPTVVIDGLKLVIITIIARNLLIPGETDFTLKDDKLLVPVPGNFQEIKKADFSLALAWRNKTREVFAHFLGEGWVVSDLVKDPLVPNQYLYLLEREEQPDGN
ncbi:GNAT family N-acetyltransferase [Mesobacillus campisalis]|uniref:GNAT family N-acetyltransferase n=1 Tax=Mesobacillus campisalis TaxID=1408103 RepID=UPI000A07D9BF|nr:GNAT family N-acetyltransferase [Mesobacillus campisalis]